jgi:hypothetical protein
MQKEIDAINERLNRGEDKFGEVSDALSRIALHLKNQDMTMAAMADEIDKSGESTQSILEMWNGGVKTVRFFCRLAEAWRFFIKSVFIPVVIPVAMLCAFAYCRSNGVLPEWAKFLFKLIG